MTSYTLSKASPAKSRADAVVVGVVKDEQGPRLAAGAQEVATAYGRRLRALLTSLDVTGAEGEVRLVPTTDAVSTSLLVLVGLGSPRNETSPEAVRRAAGTAARAGTNAATLAVALPADTPALVGAVVEGFALGAYRYVDYRSESAIDDKRTPEVVVLTQGARRAEFQRALDDAQVVARAVAAARDWVNTPPGDLTPPAFADAVAATHKRATKGRGAPKLSLVVRDEAALAKLGCGGILGVGVGSSAPPRLVELTYEPAEAHAHLALVGKGITFDSGGLSIKPGGSMKTMKCDMAGAAAVVQATFAIAELGLPVKVSSFAPMAENMVSGTATRPGDVLRIYGGTTVEVSNTDAEGRLVLADALVRAVEQDPDVILDVATLTGAMVVALGERISGVMGSPDIVEAVVEAADSAGEQMWPMPLPDEMRERVRSSKIADLAQHDWVRWGGGLFAGAFLREFTDKRPWAHLDIAGPAFHSGGPTGHLTPGGTGAAVPALVAYARHLAERSPERESL